MLVINNHIIAESEIKQIYQSSYRDENGLVEHNSIIVEFKDGKAIRIKDINIQEIIKKLQTVVPLN